MASLDTGFVEQLWHDAQLLSKRALAEVGITGVVAVALASALVSYVLLHRIYCAFLSPLRKIPGPWHAHYTGLVLKLNILAGNRVNYVQALHEKYGPFVRVAHDEVVTCDPAAGKAIHAVGTKWRKWSHIPLHITANVFAIVDPKHHNIRQRFYTKTFSQGSLRRTMQQPILKIAQLATDGIEADIRSNSGLVNVHEWFMLFGNDVMYALTFGEGFGLMEKGKRGQIAPITPLEFHQMIAWTEYSMPIFLFGRFVLSHFSARAKAIFKADVCLNPSEDEAIAQLRMKPKNEDGRTIFANAIEDAKEDEVLKGSGKTRLTDDEIAADALGFRLAGAEPVSVTLTYLVYCVLDRPEVQKLLEDEVANVELTDGVLEQCPILRAVVLEGLRLWGGNATAMRRKEDESPYTVLGGYQIPRGTTVSTQAYSLHRNPAAWQDPLR
ncbi:hypothetical protein LTR97_005765 [Elasticomyces elasticus]|uniref:Cytochrome P450 n=1 Tax=Elasticomyces elasticus TaxID=574655 RepID=A0AAN8A256_9PEZI|nr:hypothetical protein LTR97_005765 [Elasticomyces elasticus]KAK5721707.1 hypothetical protein LTR15_006298 [Elasticomyces elasticus]